MRLPELIDLEAQLARDRDGDPAALAARDRALVGYERPSDVRSGVLSGWVFALREAHPEWLWPGRPIAQALAVLRVVLALSGLALGWAAAVALLRYHGDEPVNVWDVLLLFVGVQILLLLVLLASLLLPVARLGTPVLGPLRGVLAAVYPRLAARALGARGAERGDAWRALWHRLHSRRSLYHAVEPWLLLGLAQTLGVAFNVGAIAGFLRVVVFSDVAFGWSSTLVALDASRFHALVSALAVPFGWLWPDAVPSPALVLATRYSRLEAAYLLSGAGRSADPVLVGGWWPFLVAAIACYGLLPRVAALAVARIRTARLLARLPLDDAEVERTVRRLVEPSVETRAPAPETASSAAPPPWRGGPGPAAEGTCAVVLWRDTPWGEALEREVALQTRRTVVAIRTAGGRDHEEGAVDWAGAVDGADPVVVVAEAFEAPDGGAVRLLRDLRRALGPQRHLLVVLVDPSRDGPARPVEGEVRTWRDGLARLEDPFLAVEPLGETP